MSRRGGENDIEAGLRFRAEVNGLLMECETRARRVARSSLRDGPTYSALRDLAHAYYQFGEAHSMLLNYPGAQEPQLRRVELELEEALHLFAASVGIDED